MGGRFEITVLSESATPEPGLPSTGAPSTGDSEEEPVGELFCCSAEG